MYLSLLSQKGDIGVFYFEWMLVFWELFLIQISCLFVFSLSTSYLHVPYFFALILHVCIILFKSRCFFHFVTKESVNTLSAFVSLSSSSFRLLSRLIVSFLLLLSTSCLFPVVRSLSSPPPYLPIPLFSYILSSQFILSHLISTHVTSHHLISLNLFQLISPRHSSRHLISSHLTSSRILSLPLSFLPLFVSFSLSPSLSPSPSSSFPLKNQELKLVSVSHFYFLHPRSFSFAFFPFFSPTDLDLERGIRFEILYCFPAIFCKKEKGKKTWKVCLAFCSFLFVCLLFLSEPR